jgi:hypothetical protein
MTELMVTVIILGLLTGIAVSQMKNEPTIDATRNIAAVVAEARRRAIAAGPIRADVGAATGLRERVTVELTNENGVGVARIYEAVETPGSATYTWSQVGGQVLPDHSEIYSVGDTAATLPGSVAPAFIGGSIVAKRFFPDGTCDAMTVYLRRTGSTDPATRQRVFVMPLTCTPGTYKDW